MKARRLELAVPGTYEPWRWLGSTGNNSAITRPAIVRIFTIRPTLQVIGSKQRPRKLTMLGADGRDYSFLLKGHEDLRQDERVMQLLGLVNCFLVEKQTVSYEPSRTASSASASLARAHSPSQRSNLTIPRFAAVPLSTNSGLLGKSLCTH